ncbi:efflux transporter outer membrane subunit [Erythrobacter westpacificensis]|uniref:Efflux transporter outer membrane subunit n=1 Tax=Erythrobacter westpacificensis TaxID=1055231 RepID=A0ABP9K2I4_9SPHN
MRNLYKAGAAFLPALLAACATTPLAEESPALPQAAVGPFLTNANEFDATAEVPDNWWKLYNSPTLDSLVEQALAANTDLRIADANLARAQAVLQEARGARLPITETSGGVSYGDGVSGAVGSMGDADISANAGFGLSYEVDFYGRVRQVIDAARADAEAQEAARDTVRVTVASETSRSFLNACSAAYALDVARESYRTSLESLELTQRLQRAGSLGMLDVERAGAAAAQARSAIPAIEAQRQFALFELAALLGTIPAEIPAPARHCDVPPEPVAALPVGDGAALLQRRPDIRQAERELAAAASRVGVATAELYPTITLGGSANFFRNDAVTGSESFSFSLGPLVSWNFPNMSTARARLRQAEAGQAAALARFDGQVIKALRDVEQAMASVLGESRRLSALTDARDRSQSAFDLAGRRYRAGSIGYLDVLLAQRDFLDARAAHAASLQRLSSQRINLFRSLGGGWQSGSSK